MLFLRRFEGSFSDVFFHHQFLYFFCLDLGVAFLFDDFLHHRNFGFLFGFSQGIVLEFVFVEVFELFEGDEFGSFGLAFPAELFFGFGDLGFLFFYIFFSFQKLALKL